MNAMIWGCVCVYVCLRTHTQTNTRDKQVSYRYSFLLVNYSKGKQRLAKAISPSLSGLQMTGVTMSYVNSSARHLSCPGEEKPCRCLLDTWSQLCLLLHPPHSVFLGDWPPSTKAFLLCLVPKLCFLIPASPYRLTRHAVESKSFSVLPI